MSALRFVLVDSGGIAPYAPQLRELERGIRYPIADGADFFTIDHGAQYHPFFSSLGEAYFLLALRGDAVVGSVTGVVRQARVLGRAVNALYICDLKVRPEERGKGVFRALLLRGLVAIARTPSARRCRVLYGAAMRGERGDVMRTARGMNPLRLGAPLARLAVYFAAPAALAALDPSGAPRPPQEPGVELGPAVEPPSGLFSTVGRKDLVLGSTGAPWPLVHLPLGPRAWGTSWGHSLRRSGEALAAQGAPDPACFSIDERLHAHVRWLAEQGIAAGATCTVYALSLGPRVRRAGWVHLPTSEI